MAHAFESQSSKLIAPSMRGWRRTHSRTRPNGSRRKYDQRHESVQIDVLRKIFEQWIAQTPPGWQRLMSKTADKLMAVQESRQKAMLCMARNREEAIAVAPDQSHGMTRLQCKGIDRFEAVLALTYTASDVAIRFGMDAATDQVVRGILRKAAISSHCICRQCGAPGRPRRWASYGAKPDSSLNLFKSVEVPEKLEVHFGTFCAHCAAPLMLQEHLCVLEESIVHLQMRGRHVALFDIPPLLHPSFLSRIQKHRSAQERLSDQKPKILAAGCLDEVTCGEKEASSNMPLSLFMEWACYWMEVKKKMNF